MNDQQKLTAAEVTERLPAEFRQLLDQVYARFRTKDFAAALELTDRIGAAAEAMDHHPDLDLRWGRLDVRLSSHDVGGITDRDIRLARQISDVAAELGATPDTATLQRVEVGLDTWSGAELSPFWQALLGYDEVGGVDLVDPNGAGPTIWFQETDEHETPRQRFHLDVWVPIDQAEARVAAALAAGGRLVTDQGAPAFWVLADAHGNRACVCTAAGRSG